MENHINYDEDLYREEKIDGKIYLTATPSDEHRDVQGNLNTIFNNFFKKNKKRCISRFDARLNIDDDNFFEPDLMVFYYNNSKDIPLIIIEVLSSSTRDRDLGIKMEKYAKLGIKEYWIITWELFTIDIYLLSDEDKYKHYKSYSYSTFFTLNKKRTNAETEIETIKEFSPMSVPELKINLEDVFYFIE